MCNFNTMSTFEYIDKIELYDISMDEGVLLVSKGLRYHV